MMVMTTKKCMVGLMLTMAIAISSATQITGKVVVKSVLEGGHFKLGHTKVSLRGAEGSYNTTAFVRADGGFSLGNVPIGAYVVEMIAPEYVVEPERLEVREDRVRCKYFDEHRGSHGMLVIPLYTPSEYFVPRPKFDINVILKNPMMIITGVSILFMVIMPKLMENMDPEELKQMKGDQRVILPNGDIVEREELIPKWAPPSVKKIKTCRDEDDEDDTVDEVNF